MLGAAVPGKPVLKLLHLWAENVLAMLHDHRDRVVDAITDPAPLCLQIDERDLLRRFGLDRCLSHVLHLPR